MGGCGVRGMGGFSGGFKRVLMGFLLFRDRAWSSSCPSPLPGGKLRGV